MAAAGASPLAKTVSVDLQHIALDDRDAALGAARGLPRIQAARAS